MSTRIYITGTGAKKYVGGTVTETTGKDISGATFLVGLSASAVTPPTTWVAPSVNTAGASTAQRILKLLVDVATAPGTYACWAKVTDNPEIEPLVLQDHITVI